MKNQCGWQKGDSRSNPEALGSGQGGEGRVVTHSATRTTRTKSAANKVVLNKVAVKKTCEVTVFVRVCPSALFGLDPSLLEGS